jgi:hypothetical protein
MRNAALRTLALVGLAGFLLGACGGKAVGGGPPDSSGSGGSAASGGSAGSTSSSGGSAGGGSCIDVNLASYDQSCNQASDCVYVQSGEVCSGQCGCGNSVINAAGEARYRQATASIDWAECMCLDQPAPQCVDHRCTTQSSVPDAGTDAGSCVNVDLSTYDQSCNQDSDCVYVQSGEVCSGQCGCGNSVVNADGEARYQQATASIDWADCMCPAQPTPQCVGHRCTSGSSVKGSCVNVDLSTYDQTCKVDSDCIDVTSGQICTGGCACGGSAINVDGEARYEAAVASVQTLACPCPADGVPRCIQNRCTLCGVGPNQPPGCGPGG